MSVELLRKTKDMPCVICKKVKGLQSYPIHIIPRRHGGPTEAWNIIALCADHHIQWHLLMPFKLCKSNEVLAKELNKRGFYFDSIELKHPILEQEIEDVKKNLVTIPKKRKDGSTL